MLSIFLEQSFRKPLKQTVRSKKLYFTVIAGAARDRNGKKGWWLGRGRHGERGMHEGGEAPKIDYLSLLYFFPSVLHT